MLDKKDTKLVTLALLCALAAAEKPAVASTFAAVLAQTPTPTALPTPTPLPGLTQLRIASSSSMEKFNEALKQRFEQQFSGQQVTIGYGDSSAALQAVREEKADLAAIGRPLTRREKARGLVEVPVARNKIAIVVGANNPFNGSLTDQQFARIFRGEIQDWSELGGAPGRIRVIDRPETSDLRQTLAEYPVFQAARFDTGATGVKLSEDSTQAVVRELGNDGIGIAIADQVLNQPGIRVLPMHKTTPDDPRYPFSQRLFYVYKKTNTSAALQNFLGYATAPQGQSAIAEARTVLAAATPPATPVPETAPPGTTIAQQPLTPAATPFPGTTPPAAIPAATASPQATVTPAAATDATASTSTSDAGVQGVWWLWVLGLLGFLLWGWLKNKRSQPRSNQHLSLSSLDAIEPGESPNLELATAPTSPRSVPAKVPAVATITKEASPHTANQEQDIAIASSEPINDPEAALTQAETSESVSDSQIPPSDSPEAALTQAETSESVSDSQILPSDSPEAALTQAETSEPVSAPEIPPPPPIPAQPESSPAEATPSIPTSGLIAWSEIAAGDIVPSKPTAESELSPTASEITPETPEPVSNITEPALLPIGHQVEDTTSATDEPPVSSDLAAEEVSGESDSSLLQPIAAEEPLPTASQLTPETGLLVAENTTTAASLPIVGAAIATGAAILSASPEPAAEKLDSSTPTGDESTIVLVCNQPEWAYAYWNISNEQKEKLRQQGVSKLALRLYDVTDIDLNNQQPESIEQNDCSEDSRDGYLTIPVRDRDYMVEIGYFAESDRWSSLAKSAVVRIPPTSEEERQLADVEFEALRLMSKSPVSPELLSSSGGKLGVTNLLDTSDDSSTSTETTRHGKLRLVGDVELSVYGETAPDAKVTVDGREIELHPSGTFRCQMLFPDGESELTIAAVGADGETDSIQIKLTRQTLKPNPTQST